MTYNFIEKIKMKNLKLENSAKLMGPDHAHVHPMDDNVKFFSVQARFLSMHHIF
jgi:hypothetical protein